MSDSSSSSVPVDGSRSHTRPYLPRPAVCCAAPRGVVRIGCAVHHDRQCRSARCSARTVSCRRTPARTAARTPGSSHLHAPQRNAQRCAAQHAGVLRCTVVLHCWLLCWSVLQRDGVSGVANVEAARRCCASKNRLASQARPWPAPLSERVRGRAHRQIFEDGLHHVAVHPVPACARVRVRVNACV